VKNFLNNVVAIDDRLFFGSTPDRLSDDKQPEIEDSFDHEMDDVGLGVPNVPPTSDTKEDFAISAHNLDYQDLSLAFAKYGINCSAFIPDSQRFKKSVLQAAINIKESVRRADITILDWSMDDKFDAETGTLAKTSIGEILKHDKYQHGRLRLIVIYTAEPDLEGIAEDIKNHSQNLENTEIQAFRDGRNIGFITPELEFCKISVIDKKISANDLREEVIALFTELTAGLLSNATLSAIGELRDNTHHILHSFNKHLDPAYMSHVLGLLSSPDVRENAHEVAFDYATDLISEEFKSSLQISENIKTNINLQRLKDWADYICTPDKKNSIQIKLNNTSIEITSNRLKRLLEITTEQELETVLTEAPIIAASKKKFTSAKIEIIPHGATGNSHESLSAIECKRRDMYSVKESSPTPTIKLGSIIERNDEYFICMQPLCDTVRIKQDCNFIFLKIDKSDDTDKFTHVIKRESNNFLKLNIKPDSKGLHVFTFTPDGKTNTIKTIREKNQLIIKYKKDDGQLSSLIWVGELKNNIAQSIVNSLSAQISRVGLDTNEWLRSQH
jgi:hypothetical protein